VEFGRDETIVNQARLTGFKKAFERNRAPLWIARWSLYENLNDRNEILSFMRVAILLKRKINDRFCSTLTIKAKADMRYKFQDRSEELSIALVAYDPGLPQSVPPKLDSKDLRLVNLQNILAAQPMTIILTHNAIPPQTTI
jgi:hypothetical protein